MNIDLTKLPSVKQQMAAHKQIATSATKLQEKIHTYGVIALAHAEQHGDARMLQNLYNSLPNGQRREALLKWSETYSPVRVTQKGAKCGVLKESAKTYVPFDIEGAMANPYWELDERNGFSLDLDSMNFKAIVAAALKQKLKRIDKAVEADADEKDPYTLDFNPDELKAAIIADARKAGFEIGVATPEQVAA